MHTNAIASEKISDEEILFRSCLLYPLPTEIKREIFTPFSRSERMSLRHVSRGTRAYIDDHLWPCSKHVKLKRFCENKFERYINHVRFGTSDQNLLELSRITLNSVAYTSEIFPYPKTSLLHFISHLPYNSLRIKISSTEKNLDELNILKNLTHLDLAKSYLNDTKIAVLSKLIHLKSLDLAYNNIAEKGANIIAKLTPLMILDVSHNFLTDEGTRHLTTLTNLKILKIRDNNTRQGFNYLSVLTNLTKLDISSNKISTEVVSLSSLTNLRILKIRENCMKQKLSALSVLTNLTKLDISFNKIGTEIVSLSTLSNLEHLKAVKCGIRDEVNDFLKNMNKLEMLNLYRNPISSLSTKHLTNLTYLNN